MIGFLADGLRHQRPYLVPAIRRGLEDADFILGRRGAVESRFAGDHYDQPRGLADELLRDDAAVIVADGAAAAVAAKSVTQNMPVVFMITTDPVKLGLFDRRIRPRANLPCIVMFDTELNATHLELLHELITKDAAIALFLNPKNPNADLLTQEVEASPTARGHIPQVIGVSSEAGPKAAFTVLRQRQVAVIVETDPVLNDHLWSDRMGGGILRCDAV